MTSGGASSSRPRVLILLENYPAPSDRRVWAESRSLERAGYDVTIVCPTGDGREEAPNETIGGISIHRFPRWEAGSGRGYLVEYGRALWHMRRLARRLDAQVGGFDVVQLCNPPDILFWSIRSLRRRGARVVFDHHDLAPELSTLRWGGPKGALLHRVSLFFERRTFRTADVVLCPNESYRRVAVERGGKRADDVFVVRIAPDLDWFRPGDRDDALKRGKPYLIAYVGTMGHQDGLDHALRSLELLGRKRQDWHAVLAGSGDAADDMRKLAAKLGLDGRVEFTGHLADEQLLRLLSTADVCLSPEPRNALNEASTMIKVVEYMALARPIVAFDLAETRFSAGEAALYATPNDDRVFADCIDRLLDDESLRARMGTAGRGRLESSLSWPHSERNLLAAYDRVLGHAPSTTERAA
jgi:glycosyltransferase involved in cell wall biosynthesis